jgi:hypothetical protein
VILNIPLTVKKAEYYSPKNPWHMNKPADKIKKISWVYISGIVFILSLVLSVIMILYSGKLTNFGITRSVYYIILIPLGLCAAGFLFGALHSYAKYTGKNSFGQLELTGPVVIFCLVVAGGFYLAEPDSDFLLTVRVSTPDNQIVKSGSIILDLGSQRLKKEVGENGETLFAEVPSKYSGSKIGITPQIEGYTSVKTIKEIPSDKIVTIDLVPQDFATVIRGTVTDVSGNAISGVKINFESGMVVTQSDEMGNFTASLPVKPGTTLLVTATLNGKTGYREYIAVPSSGSVLIPFILVQ